MPNTFNKTVILKLKGVNATSDANVNAYREDAAGRVSIYYKLYKKSDVQQFVEFTEGSASYDRNTGTYRIYMINIPDTYRTDSILLVKANKHLGMKFCTNGQAARCDAAMERNTGLNLSGSQPLDQTVYPLLPGDIDQNRVFNGTDIVLMLQQLARDPSARSTQDDLNYDGVVRGDDYNLMLDSIGVYDDE
jgi:hypothetical protein